MADQLPNLLPAFPEIFLAIAAMLLMMVGVYKNGDTLKTVGNLAVLSLAVAFLLLMTLSSERVVTLSGLFVMDGFAIFMKSLVLLGSGAAILMSVQYLRERGINRFEFPVLILLATLGMLMMISANNFMSLYLGLELQSLSLYVLAAMDRDRQRSSEAGLKYFVLGALSSGMLLYGISLIYGFTGTTSFDGLAAMFDGSSPSMGVIIGLVFILAGLAFKISAVPFHMWTPDVYEGAPTPVTAFFAAAPKIAAMALIIRVLVGSFPHLADQWQQIIIFISIASMLLGAFAALVQTNIKRLMAYSSIGHVGFALVGLAAGGVAGVESVLVYMAIYLTMTVGTFACILSMRHEDGFSEEISDLAGLSTSHPKMALAMAIFMFSLAGIPLLAGFFGKFFIFKAAIDAELYSLAIIGVVASVVGAVYYLRIVKIMYFDEPVVVFTGEGGRSVNLLMGLTAIVNSPVSFLLIYSLLAAAGTSAASLFQ
jgi:NADH-quinone oxidoreductase subunit N